MLGDAFEAYAATLHELSAGYDFGEATDKAVRDQLLEEAASQYVRERLLFEDTSLALNHVVDIGRHTELKKHSGDRVVQRMVDKFFKRE